ncbi:Card1-like endonuclease domain-containing protein [Methylomicrobium agile]|uniref:Card1-like endonuclease domain-containing protein n=1 Tax=Methylomicrobium agile TaxID=39774 RepID=UPI000A05912D|nr:DUF1887 family CARF protein [Methylomicrobium agile]
MTISTHLILVSAQPIPNITPILDDSLRPQKVVMLVSPDMTERSQALENIFKPRGIRIERCTIDNPGMRNTSATGYSTCLRNIRTAASPSMRPAAPN